MGNWDSRDWKKQLVEGARLFIRVNLSLAVRPRQQDTRTIEPNVYTRTQPLGVLES